MMRKTLLSVALALGVAGWAIAQTESQQPASPTTSSYRVQILEPSEGSTITGSNVRIVIAKPDAALTPTFQVWVDGKDYGDLPTGENTFTASDLSYGPHTAIVAAKNSAGEVIGRMELKFTTAEAAGVTTTMETSSTTERTEMAPAPPAAVAPPPPAPVAVPAPEPVPEPAMEERMTADSPTLPATGTNYPLAALAGLGLMGAGLALRRRA